MQLIRDGLVNISQVDLGNCDSSQPLQGVKILEVGCGGGILCEVFTLDKIFISNSENEFVRNQQ